MKYLAMDTSGNHLTVIARNNDLVEVSFLPECNLRHSVILMGEVEKVLEKVNMQASEVDFFACSVGAGSFTGIRIGVATVKAFAFSLNKPVLSVTSFDILAYNNCNTNKFLTVIDCKHDHVYACGYENKQVILKPCFISLNELKELSKEYELIASSSLEGFDIKIVDLANGFKNAVESNLQNLTYDRELLEPLYVRKSQAEEAADVN